MVWAVVLEEHCFTPACSCSASPCVPALPPVSSRGRDALTLDKYLPEKKTSASPQNHFYHGAQTITLTKGLKRSSLSASTGTHAHWCLERVHVRRLCLVLKASVKKEYKWWSDHFFSILKLVTWEYVLTALSLCHFVLNCADVFSEASMFTTRASTLWNRLWQEHLMTNILFFYFVIRFLFDLNL